MQRGKGPIDPQAKARILAQVQQTRSDRDSGYREQAMRLFPHVCARCGRAFAGKTLRELTVHHRDHNHSNNPPDGSNWELLCLYCHDNEHQDPEQRAGGYARPLQVKSEEKLGFNAFAALGNLLPPESSDSDRTEESS